MTIAGNSDNETTVGQQLSYQGSWCAEVFSDGNLVKTYSFNVELNKAVADIRINQLNDLQFSKLLGVLGFIVGLISLIISALALHISRLRRHSDEPENDEDQSLGYIP
jgi:hypothetical protein